MSERSTSEAQNCIHCALPKPASHTAKRACAKRIRKWCVYEDAPRPETAKVCGEYLGDNDGTCPQLTCVREKGHAGPHDNVTGDAPRPASAPTVAEDVRRAQDLWSREMGGTDAAFRDAMVREFQSVRADERRRASAPTGWEEAIEAAARVADREARICGGQAEVARGPTRMRALHEAGAGLAKSIAHQIRALRHAVGLRTSDAMPEPEIDLGAIPDVRAAIEAGQELGLLRQLAWAVGRWRESGQGVGDAVAIVEAYEAWRCRESPLPGGKR